MDNDDQTGRTVTKPQARVVDPPPDSEATVIRPPPAAKAAAGPAPKKESGNQLPVGTFLGEFEITELIGEGGFGIVYLARDHSLQRRVALKEYMPSALAARTGPLEVSVKAERYEETFEAGLKSFVNEARLLASFDHPSLVKVYRFWEANGTAYMVMPFYEGVTLKQKLKEMGAPPNEAWLLDLLGPLTEALLVIHADQCYHRAIAPDNVLLLKGTGRPLLLDFGAARRVIGDMTQALTVILKPGYAPVEQYAEVPGMKQGAWTDVYALAAVVYYAIVGKTPPPSVGRLMNDNYEPLAKLTQGRFSPRFAAAIDRALRVKPEERTQSIEELRHELGLDTQAPAPRPAAPRAAAAPAASTAPRAAEGSKRGSLLVLAGLAALVVAGGAGYALLGGKAPAPAPVAVVAPAPPPPASAVEVAAAPPAPVAAPAPPPPAAIEERFDPLKDFERVAAAQSGDFGVEAGTAKPQFRIDRDFLSFTVKTAKEGHLYVFLNGSDGVLTQIFPNASTRSNKLRAGQTITLPPPQSNWAMKASGPAGVDHFIAIVSEHPRDYAAAGLKVQDGFGMASADAVAAAARALGGATPLFLGKPVCPGECADHFGAALFSSEQIP